MNARQYNIKYLGNYIKENCNDEYRVSEATLVLNEIKKAESKKKSRD